MKKRKDKPKKAKTKKSSENKITKDVTKQVGIINGFLVYDKIEENSEKKFDFLFNQPIDPSLQDWLIVQPSQSQSRFSGLFQEILENDKKSEKNKKNEIKIDNDIDKEDEKLLPNNLIEENDEEDFKFDNNKILEEKMKNLSINDSRSDISFELNNNMNNLNNINIINNNIINNSISNDNNINKINNINNINIPNQNQNIINNFPNINNNNMNNNNIIFNYVPNLNTNNTNNNNLNNINNFNKMNFYYYKEKNGGGDYSNPNSGFPSAAPTAPSSMDRTSSLYSILSNSSGSFFGQVDNNDYYGYNNNKNTSQEKYEKKLELNIDIKRILSLEDRRTTLMIKNIPNKFKRDLLLKIINENFKGAYDLFILPTDANGYKNFGYSFINFTSSYYIPYFYYLFDHKKWSSTNSQKICEITYSKIQGINNLLSHYPNKIIYRNNEVKKIDNDNKYIIPNDYNKIFNSIYPNYIVEKHATYFITKMPFRY
jgi:hypothetical protein